MSAPKKIDEDDTFPLWSFGYNSLPSTPEEMNRIMTSRGRTWQEAWHCIQALGKSFQEPSKVSLIAVVALAHKVDYDKTHPYK